MSEYPPTSIVLAKVKGYPAWPAMVLDESLLPEHISNKKPKSKTNHPTTTTIGTTPISSPSKKKPSIIVPVRFFSDDTYIWININDLKPLTKQMIQDYFSTSSKKRRIDNLLQTAYELANDPPEMELFIEYGSKGAPPPMEEEEEEKEEKTTSKSPVKKKVKKVVKEKAKAKAKAKAKPKPKAKSKQLPIVKPKTKDIKESIIENDPDWGLEEFNQYNKQLGNYIFDSEQEQIKNFTKLQSSLSSSSSSSLSSINSIHNNKIIDKFKSIENDLINYLLLSLNTDSSNSLSMKNEIIIKLLNDLSINIIPKLPKNIIIKSKLLRVLILSIRKPKPKPNDELKNIKSIIQNILHGLSIDIRENTEEEIIKSNKDNNKESSVSQTPEPERQQQQKEQVEDSLMKNGDQNNPIEIE
ncbi:component of the ISW1B complex, putative [Candida dubliniensis CD36]|uniref:Component of the ISW1B complex, putative n=1 Tax=Candida dubliniensis (strain CD36 / ATCC MYA-646 / CBS 7987 / NCPF 3949 / NRRL Y-17841) TaxID=573826 RepID=B9WJJ4_CANDC|nr:component of the ISW1B complex, putative [Candida dubliniensis CD36]CAX40638.1 component of the ISW1B complex, putative [Candida dubliniensis CD36]